MAKKQSLEEQLALQRKSTWQKINEKEKKEIFSFANGYKEFLNKAKTERLAVKEIIALAEKNGFKTIEKIKNFKRGEKIYFINRNKNIALCVLGEDIESGVKIVASHIDSPRLDLKPNPLYEEKDTEIALLKTHYYGGIKKYQWVNIPLALYGRIIKKDGSAIDIAIGEGEDENVFVITDLLPHLSKKFQDERKLTEGIKGEELNILVGSIPINDKDAKQKVKLFVLNYLNKKFGLIEEDLVSAELEAVPSLKARDVGFDCSLIGSYGQDDRVCAYASLKAILEVNSPKKTAIAIFVDKEEIGSEGNTGMKSKFLLNIIGELIALKYSSYEEHILRKVLTNSKSLSADVGAGLDPTFKEVHEIHNAAKIGFGVVLEKYTGSSGKSLSSEANAEFVGEIRKMLNDNKIPWQSAEIGKVDEGGGGTVAKFLAEHNMDVIDLGVPLLSMHSPFEISSKADIYFAYKSYKVFMEG